MARQPRGSQEGAQRASHSRVCFGSTAGGRPKDGEGSPAPSPSSPVMERLQALPPVASAAFRASLRQRCNAVPRIAGHPSSSPHPQPQTTQKGVNAAFGADRLHPRGFYQIEQSPC